MSTPEQIADQRERLISMVELLIKSLKCCPKSLAYEYYPIPQAEKLLNEIKAGRAYGCHCDLEPGQDPDGCVLDEGKPHHCMYVKRLIDNQWGKEACDYWRPIKGT